MAGAPVKPLTEQVAGRAGWGHPQGAPPGQAGLTCRVGPWLMRGHGGSSLVVVRPLYQLAS